MAHRRDREQRAYRTDPGGVEGDPDTVGSVDPVEPILQSRTPEPPGPVAPRGEITYTAEFINTSTTKTAVFQFELWANGELVEQSVDLTVEPGTGRLTWELTLPVEVVNEVTIASFPVEGRITGNDGSSKSFGRATYEIGDEQTVTADRVNITCEGVDSGAGLASARVENQNQQPVEARIAATAGGFNIGQQTAEVGGESSARTDVPLDKAALANELSQGETADYEVTLNVTSVEETALFVD